jgi:hypothetical protein
LEIAGTILCKTKDCPNDPPMRCAQKSCRRTLIDAEGHALSVRMVEGLTGCPYCGWKIATNSRRLCDPCHTNQLREKRDLLTQNRCLVCKQDHPRSTNGRCLHRNFRERGLGGVTPEQIAWFRKKVTNAGRHEIFEFISGKNWELIRAIGEAQFADDPLKVQAAKLRRSSMIGKKPSLGKKEKRADKKPLELLSSRWLWNAERRFRRLKKKPK